MRIPAFIGTVKSNNGVILKVKEKGIYVSPNTSCEKAAGCHGCSLCTPGRSQLKFFCSVPKSSDYAEGQCVRIHYFSFNEAVAAGVVFGLPVFCAVVTYIALSIFSNTGAETLGLVLSTTLAVVAGFALVYSIDRIIRYFYPVTIERVYENENRVM
jgi:hypothetical protein